MNVGTLTEQILRKMTGIGRWQFKFLLKLFPLLLAVRGRYNFTNLARWTDWDESTFRAQYAKPFDWLGFNTRLAEKTLSDDLVLAFDPSYLPKSGRHTPGLGYFYSGCAGRELRGLEFSGLAVIDQRDKTALHLEAVQTVDLAEQQNLLDFYAQAIVTRAEQLLLLSNHLVVDAYFAAGSFIDQMVDAGFEVTTRLRKNARLRYLYNGPKRRGRGRPRQFEGRVDAYNLREDQAQAEDGSWIAYELIANVQAWKRTARLIIIQQLDTEGRVKQVRILATTDLDRGGAESLFNYHSRFQIELLYRDAKQHVGLTHTTRHFEKLERIALG